MYNKPDSRYRAVPQGLLLEDTHLGFKEVPLSSSGLG